MKAKKEYLILSAVIVALAVYLALHSRNQVRFELPRLTSLESAKITRMVLARQGATLELTRKDEQWTIEPKGYRADAVKLKNMLKAAAELTLTDLVSEAGAYERYALSDDRKISVQLYGDGQLQREFAVGDSAPTFQHSFVLLAGDLKVYSARGTLKPTFDQSAETLRDKTVLAFDKETINGLVVQKGPQSISLVKKELPAAEKSDAKDQTATPPNSEWQNEQGRAVDQTAVERLLSGLAALQCDAFIDDKPKESFTAPAWSLIFQKQDQTYTLATYGAAGKDDQRVTATSSASAQAFLLAEGRAQGFARHIDQLLAPEAHK